MAALEKTSHPGIYKRKTKAGETRYVLVYRVAGRQRRETVGTLKEALSRKAQRKAELDSGTYDPDSRLSFREYAIGWVERYQGNGKRGFTEDTRLDYKRDLERYAFPFLDAKLGRRLSAIKPKDISAWIAWLCDEREQGRALSDNTVRRIVAPVRSCLATARREGLIRDNPAKDAVLPHRPRIEEDEEEVRAFTREQLDAFLRVVHPKWRLLFEVLAATGIRWGEAAALRWRDLELDGKPALKVRRALSRRLGAAGEPTYKPPKSRYGRRTIPLDRDVAAALRELRRELQPEPEFLVFCAVNGAPLRHSNVRRRILLPAAEEAGAPWAGFHTFRHTCASMLFEGGKNAVQVQRWLGHHSPAFTMATYVHLLRDDLGEPLDLAGELRCDNIVTTGEAELDRTQPEKVPGQTA